MSSVRSLFARLFTDQKESTSLRRYYEVEFRQSSKYLSDDVIRRNIAEAMYRV